MKKLFATLFTLSSIAIPAASVQAQQTIVGEPESTIICPYGEVEFEGSCFPVDEPGPTDEFVITAQGTVTHECSIDNPGEIFLSPALNPNNGLEFMQGRARIPFTQSSDTRWELTNIDTSSPAYNGSSITITPPSGFENVFGIGAYPEGTFLVPSRSDFVVTTGSGTFDVVATVNGDDNGNLVPGTYRTSAILSCYSSGSAVVGE